MVKANNSSSMEKDIQTVLWSAEDLSQKVTHLANQITHDFSSSSPPVIVGVATGAFLFLADLVRSINLPVTVDFVRAESYGSGTVSSGVPKLSCDVKLDVAGKHVVLVEDIVDTGNTVARLISYLQGKGATSVSVCTLLDKPARRKVHFDLLGEGKFYSGFEVEDIVDTGNTVARLISYLQGKGATSVSVCTLLDKPARRKVHFDLLGEGKFYSGFECPDSFVVGYGLDYNERYRNLPYIGVLKPEIYE